MQVRVRVQGRQGGGVPRLRGRAGGRGQGGGVLLLLLLQGCQVLVWRTVSVPLLPVSLLHAAAPAAVSVWSVLPLPHAPSAPAPVPVWPAVLLLHDAPAWSVRYASSSAASSAAAVPVPLQPVPLHAATATVCVRSAVPLHAPAPATAVPLPLLHDATSRPVRHASSASSSASGAVHVRWHDAAAAADDEPVLPDAPAVGQVPAHGHVVSSPRRQLVRRLQQVSLPFPITLSCV